MATIHLMHGFIGFGKTTVAKKLAKELPAVRLNNDDWMSHLYGTNPPAEFYDEYYNRIAELRWQLAEQLIHAGVDVIMDNGTWAKAKRAEDVARAKKITNSIVFHVVECSLETARKRCLKRNENNGQLFIEENTFDILLSKFEPIKESEGYKIIRHDNN
jgi:predicted kinase